MKPQGILDRLGSADRAWQRTRALETFVKSVKVFVLLAVIGVAGDLILQLGAQVRHILGLIALTGALAFAGVLLWHALVKRAPLERIARFLEARDPRLGTKLMNILQLAGTAKDPTQPELTRSLAQRAVEDAGRQLERRDFRPLTRSSTLSASAGWAMLAVTAALAPALVFLPIALGEVWRFLDPFGDHPPFSFTQLRITSPQDDSLKVIYKKPLVIEAEYSGHRPSELFLAVENTAKPGIPATLPLYPAGERRFTQQIDEVTSDLVLRAHTRSMRSVSQQRLVKVILTPQLEKANVTIQPPAYTRLPAHTLEFTPLGGSPANLSALEGSVLNFYLRSNRPLSGGTLALQSDTSAQKEIPMPPSSDHEEQTVSGTLTAAESGRLRFEIRDVTDLPNDRELSAGLTVTHDLPPEISITEPAQDGFIVENFAAKIVFSATDDYGLKNLRLHTGVNDKYQDPRVIECQADPPQRHAVETLRISPKEMGATPGSSITVFGEATDIRPAPQLSRTRTLKLEVITEDQYNQYLRQRTEVRELEKKYSQYQDALRDLMKTQRELAKEAAEAAQSKEGLSKEKRNELADQQADLNNKLSDLAARMDHNSREKPLYDLEKDLQKVLDQESQEIRNSIAENDKHLSSFAQDAPSIPGAKDFKEQADAQADRLDPLGAQSEKKIGEAVAEAQKMQDLVKPLNAYKELYKHQQGIAAQSAAYKDNPSLSEEDRLALQNMAADEHFTSEALQKIAKDLRTAADKAQSAYPEAAQDARDIANEMEQAQLSPLADQSAQAMLAAHGGESHDRAEHLKDEMGKLFKECSKCQGGMGGEFAMRLKMMRSMASGSTFDQMMQCQKFGMGKGQGGMGGSGLGFGGMMADGSTDGQSQSLLGGETMLGHGEHESATASNGNAEGTPSPGAARADEDINGKPNGLTPSSRPTGSVTGDAVLDEYDQVVNAYFRRLTTGNAILPSGPKPKPASP